MSDVRSENFTVINTAGVHLRPAQLIASLSTSFPTCDVAAVKDGIRINAKSIMGIMALVGSCGSEITFEVSGERADECLEKLRALFDKGFDEDIDPRFRR
mgnify:CR=1 FL=1